MIMGAGIFKRNDHAVVHNKAHLFMNRVTDDVRQRFDGKVKERR